MNRLLFFIDKTLYRAFLNDPDYTFDTITYPNLPLNELVRYSEAHYS